MNDFVKSKETDTPLTGTITAIKLGTQTEGNNVGYAIVSYKDRNVFIFLKEMVINTKRYFNNENEYTSNIRFAKLLNPMIGAEIDFIVTFINDDVVVGSRKNALMQLRISNYLYNEHNGNEPNVSVGSIIPARILAVREEKLWVEVYGVETGISKIYTNCAYADDLRDKYFVGDFIDVIVKKINGSAAENLKIRVNECHDEKVFETIAIKENYSGFVTNNKNNMFFVALDIGIHAIALKCFDNRKPHKGDKVVFTVIYKNENTKFVKGVISRIIKKA